MSRSYYTALILEKWFADGCPAVTPADEALQTLKLAGGIAAERAREPYLAARKRPA